MRRLLPSGTSSFGFGIAKLLAMLLPVIAFGSIILLETHGDGRGFNSLRKYISEAKQNVEPAAEQNVEPVD